MTPDREQRAGTLFLTAIELGAAERHRLLEEVGTEDPSLRYEVETLLLADERNCDGFLRAPIAEAALSELELLPSTQREHVPITTIGAYRVLKELGVGEHAVVYLAQQDEPVERRVAIKVLWQSDGSGHMVRRFETERRILALMDHPNIARLYEAGVTHDGRAYFVMEYVDGGPISAYCRDAVPSLKQRLELFCQVCSAVEHAHQRGIIHRDLKPTNILVTGAPGTVKVIDFGVARATGAGLYSFPSYTVQGQLVGTIGYMSPEQVGGDGSQVDTRSDVYGLGAVLYELLCESPAIVTLDAGPATVIARITTEGPLRPSALRPSLRGDVEIIITKAMDRDASSRYQTVAALREDIERFLSSRPIAARAPSAIYLARRFIGRHHLPVAMLLVIGALLTLFAARMWNAERVRFDIAVEMAQSWFDHSQHLARTAGERQKRRPFLERLATQSDDLLKQAPNHPGVLRLRGNVLGAMGDLALEDGNADEAMRLFTVVRTIRALLVRARPDSFDSRMDLSVALVRIGDTAKFRGDLNAAEDLYDQARELDQITVDAIPDSPRAVTLLAWSYDRLASMAVVRKDPVLADALYKASLDYMERLNALEQSPDARRGLSVAHAHVSETARREGNITAYRAHTLSSHEHAEAAAALEPENRLAQWAFLSARLRMLEAYADTFGPETAREFALSTLGRARYLALLDPTDEPIHACHIGALDAAARLIERDGDVNRALAYRRILVEETRRYLERRPRDSEAKAGLGNAERQLGDFVARHHIDR